MRGRPRPCPRRRERPQQLGEVDIQIADRTGVGDGGLDLRAVAHDAGVGHQPRNVTLAVARDTLDIELVECAAEVVSLAQDDQPRQATLKRLEGDSLEQRLGVPQRLAPLGVVIVPVHDEIIW